VTGPHLVVIVDGGALAGNLMTGSGVEGVTVLDLTSVPPRSPDPSTLVVTVAADGTMSSGDTELGVADDMDVVAAEALARQLAPPAPARASCCGPWCSPWRSPIRPTPSTSRSSTSRAGPPSPGWTSCRTPAP